MKACTSDNVREFILQHYRYKLAQMNIELESISEQFDLLSEGVIDSLGILELISAIESVFGISVDLEELDAEQLTIVGPLSEYIARTARPEKGDLTENDRT